MTKKNISQFKSGIYQIVHVESGKRYIGQSKNVSFRLRKHKQRLVANTHVNKFLQNAWNKYLADAFLFEPIIYCSLKELNKYEEFYIEKYSSNKKDFGYNFRVVSSSNNGMVFESRAYGAGEKYNLLTLVSRAPNKNGIIRWNCLCDCGKTVEVTVAAVVSGNTKSCGCIWGRYVFINGEKMRFTSAERILGIPPGGLSKFVKKYGAPVEIAVEYYVLKKKIESYKLPKINLAP